MKTFNYFSPETKEAAFEILTKCGKEAVLMAGGTDLLVMMKNEELSPQYVIDLKRIPNLKEIKYDEKKGLDIGALVTIHEIEQSPAIKMYYSILTEAASNLGSVQIRNKGTIGGNLCHASPSADLVPSLIALESKVRILRKNGDRFERLENFFLGPGLTILNSGEILTEIQIPVPSPYSNGVYLKFSPRKAMDLAMVSVATMLTINPSNSICTKASIVLGAVAPTPIRAVKSEKLLEGKKIEKYLIEEVSNLAAKESRPISDIRGSAWYRKEIVKVLVQRSIIRALEKIKL